MAVSIVTNSNPSDDAVTNNHSSQDISIKEESFLGNSTSSVDTKDAAQSIQADTASPQENGNDRLNALHPEQEAESKVSEQNAYTKEEEQIPNMYIKADAEQATPAIQEDKDIFSTTQTAQEVSSDGFDVDDILGEETVPPEVQLEQSQIHDPTKKVLGSDEQVQQPMQVDPFAQVIKPDTLTPESIWVAKQENVPQKKSMTKPLITVVWWLLIILVLWFIIKTMFPAWLWNQDVPTIENTIETVAVETGSDNTTGELHAVAEDVTGSVEFFSQKLEDYAMQWESYYQKWRDFKDRDMVRYALYVEKKAKDLIQMLDLDPNMDTKEIVVYFAQFDDYLQTLSERENDLILNPPAVESTTWFGATELDVNNQQQSELSEFTDG